MAKRIIVGISGASGIVYGVRALQLLRDCAVQTHLVMSKSAKLTLHYELDMSLADLEALALELLSAVTERKVITGRLPPVWLKRAQEIIADSPDDAPSVAILARMIGVHPVHLARVFRAHLGMSPGEYARRRRIERATDRMLRTAESLAEIAATLGYADESHFTREFSRESGQTPARFRAALN